MLQGKNKLFFICLVTGLLTTICWWVIAQNPTRLLEFFTQQFYDSQLRNYPIDPHPEKILIINIDEASLKEFGQWPWPRIYFAEIHRKLLAHNPKAIVYPWVMSDQDRSSPTLVIKTLNLENITSILTDYDHLFAEAIDGSPTILGCLLLNNENERGRDLAFIPQASYLTIKEKYHDDHRKFKAEGIWWDDNNLKNYASKQIKNKEKTNHHFKAILPPLDLFSRKATISFSNLIKDNDGKIRRACLIHRQNDNLITHFTLRSLLMEQGISEITLIKDQQENFVSIENPEKKLHLPVSKDGTIFIHFHHCKYRYPEISAKDLLTDSFDENLIENRVVFIGTSSVQLNELANTPLGKDIPIIEINAAIIDNLFNRSYIITPAYLHHKQIHAITVTGLTITIISSIFPLTAVFLTICLSIITLIISSYCFSIGLFFNPLFIIGTMVSIIFCLFIVRSLLASKKREILREAFNRYLSPKMVEQIEEGSFNIFTGQSKEVTLMFADIRDFTSLSEKLSPEQIVNLLNQYFTPMTACVKKHGGTVDKLIGDALMAFWNAPISITNHAQRAVETALDMQKKLQRLNQKLINEFNIKLKIGIGIHTGKVYVGNMGSNDFLDYTCIGDNVNLTSRVENLCKYYDFPILITLNTAQQCKLKHFIFRTLDQIQVKGKSQPIVIQAVLTSKEFKNRYEEFTQVDRAVELYKKGKFKEAILAFEKIKSKFPKAESGCSLYINRCQKLLLINLKEWNGIWKFKDK